MRGSGWRRPSGQGGVCAFANPGSSQRTQVMESRQTDLNGDRNGVSAISGEVAASVPWLLGSKALLFIVGIAVPIILARGLGPAGLGELALCRVLSDVLALACGLGLSTSILRFFPELAANRNASGMLRLVSKTSALQFAAFCTAATVMYLLRHPIGQWFNASTESFVVLALVLTAAALAREFSLTIYTSMFWGRAVAVMSVLQGAMWLLLLAAFFVPRPGIGIAVLSQSAPPLLTSAVATYLFVRYMLRLDWNRSTEGVGRRRTLRIAIPSMLNGLTGMVLRQHTELFFLGVYVPGAAVGYYELGCGMPLLAVTFLPLTLHQLFTAGFAQSYAKDPNCLGSLVQSYFRVLILTVLPIAVFGMFFSISAVPLIYGEAMAPAGPVAAAFFGLHLLTLVSPPLSLAVITKEKVLHMLPVALLQCAINLVLDVVLISQFGIAGAIGAVLGTWVLTTPLSLYLVSRFIGGMYFPLAFFLRIGLVASAIAAALYVAVPHEHWTGLIAAGLIFVASFAAAIRGLRLVCEEDISELRALRVRRLDLVLDFLVGGVRA